jgi:hypothetical protein
LVVVRRRRSVAYRLARGVVVLALLAGASVLIAFGLSRARPGWWRDLDPQDKAVVDAALRVENGAATQLTKIRKSEPGVGAVSEPWTIKLSSADANAWLAARLRPWLESQEGAAAFRWPKEVRRVEVEFDAGRIYIGASVTKRASTNEPDETPRSQILTASLRPEFRDGGLWLPAESMSVGRLSVPASWMLPGASENATSTGGTPTKRGLAPNVPDTLAKMPQMKELIAALSGGRPAMQSPIIKIGDGRRVKIMSLDARDGALYITCQTLSRETSHAQSEPGGASRRPMDPMLP